MARGDIQIINPAKKFFTWKGGDGKLLYYDKEAKSNIDVSLPFTFLWLDDFTTIKGFNESSRSSIWSNEIRDISKDILIVKDATGIIAKGLYKDIKEKIVSYGGGYAKSCYIAYFDNDVLTIGNILFTGSSFGGGIHKPSNKDMKDIEVGGWLSFSKRNMADIVTKAIIMEKDPRLLSNGGTKFYAPSFKLIDVSQETNAKAIELVNILKEYHLEYFKKNLTQEELSNIESDIQTRAESEALNHVDNEAKFESNSQDKPFINERKSSLSDDDLF